MTEQQGDWQVSERDGGESGLLRSSLAKGSSEFLCGGGVLREKSDGSGAGLSWHHGMEKGKGMVSLQMGKQAQRAWGDVGSGPLVSLCPLASQAAPLLLWSPQGPVQSRVPGTSF